ncbi:EGF-like repeat and discoidin I-like domain-containing protein 3 [Acropora millepora]|uniref:EGF-like repeat and discoidin I-like domain-containing protein 3 n=1 Tax=Acropora millepora TaxID=45264 RepID=UPI001CF2AA60|nr:EGF-like repeat and discoidin I-like domain-containing protein 3 [Acropora millepora]
MATDPFPVKMVWFLPPECKEPLGMESGAISDKQITASSTFNHLFIPSIGRLHHKVVHHDETRGGAWVPRDKNSEQWLQVDLGPQRTTVKMVATQGRYGRPQWVKTYKLQYSSDGGSFRDYKKTFDGNSDQNTVVYNELNPPINARFIRFRPTLWNNYIAMRVELYGCHGNA